MKGIRLYIWATFGIFAKTQHNCIFIIILLLFDLRFPHLHIGSYFCIAFIQRLVWLYCGFEKNVFMMQQ